MKKSNKNKVAYFDKLIEQIDSSELVKLRKSASSSVKRIKEQSEIDRLELMENYWLNRLNSEEKTLFEERLLTDKILNSDFKDFKKSMNLIKKSSIEMQMIKTLKKLSK